MSPFSCLPGLDCSKLTTSLVNVSLKFNLTIISEIHQYFCLEKCDKLLHSFIFNKKYQCDW